jgi:hypothetical protein
MPDAGRVAITVLVRTRAIKKTSYNRLNYLLRDSTGQLWKPVRARDPDLVAGDLRPGQKAEGWVSFPVPTQRVKSLALVYNSMSFLSDTPPELVVKLGTPLLRQAKIGVPYAVGREHALTVLGAEEWEGDATALKPGQTFVTSNVRITARTPTPKGAFTLMDAKGTQYTASTSSRRSPAFEWNGTLPAGKTLEGWVTFAVPKTELGKLSLCYHAHDRAGPSVLTALGALRVAPNPPVAEARLEGSFDTVLTFTASNGFNIPVGSTDDVTFTFQPTCASGACDGTLSFTVERWAGVSTTVNVPLIRSGASYTGTTSATMSSCGSSIFGVTGTVEVRLEVAEGGWAGGVWRATRLTGFERYSTPDYSSGLYHCPPASWDANLTSSLRP